MTNNPYTRVLDDGTIQQAGSLDNPYFIQEERIREVNRDVMNGNISMSYDIRPWLKLSVRSGLDFYVDKTEMRIAKGSLTNSGNTYGSSWGPSWAISAPSATRVTARTTISILSGRLHLRRLPRGRAFRRQHLLP